MSSALRVDRLSELVQTIPFHWLIREAIFGLAVALPALYLAGRAWPFVALGMLGAIYPDVEKVLSVDFHIPDQFILFAWHSTELSSRTGGLPRPLLIGSECVLIAAFFIIMWPRETKVVQHIGQATSDPLRGSQ